MIFFDLETSQGEIFLCFHQLIKNYVSLEMMIKVYIVLEVHQLEIY